MNETKNSKKVRIGEVRKGDFINYHGQGVFREVIDIWYDHSASKVFLCVGKLWEVDSRHSLDTIEVLISN
jgi:hypothetical protein